MHWLGDGTLATSRYVAFRMVLTTKDTKSTKGHRTKRLYSTGCGC
jgi:hypothetical protein